MQTCCPYLYLFKIWLCWLGVNLPCSVLSTAVALLHNRNHFLIEINSGPSSSSARLSVAEHNTQTFTETDETFPNLSLETNLVLQCVKPYLIVLLAGRVAEQ